MVQHFPISHRRITDFDLCARQFQHKHILKDVPPSKGPHLDRGNAIDAALTQAVKTGIVPPGLEHMRKIILAIYLREGETHTQLELALTWGLKECDWFDQAHVWFRAKFDMLMFDGDVCTVIDWKTGQIREDSKQLERYAFAVFAAWPFVNTVKTIYAWVDHKTISPPAIYTRAADYERIGRDIVGRSKIIDAAINAKEFGPTKNDKCKWCPVLPAMCEFKP